MADVETVIIGAGVIGLATARALSKNQTVYVLEREKQFGQHISSHNSEVIHSGIYYPSQFLKTQLCIEGRQLLLSYCQQHDIPHQQTGKLVIASSPEQISKLQQLQQQALRNGINNTQLLNQEQTLQKEPELAAQASLWVPDSGIIDSHTYMQQLEADIFNNGSSVLYQHHIHSVEKSATGFILHFNQQEKINCKQLILTAGLNTQSLALGKNIPTLYPCKGHYFSYQKISPFSHLIYPLPENHQKGLGIHATLNMEGNLTFGPDTFYQNNHSYQFETDRKTSFINAIKHYWPSINTDYLHESYTGIRPKIQGPTDSAQDFILQSETEHGIKGLIQCFGIESPGLTASLAIAKHIKGLTTTQW